MNLSTHLRGMWFDFLSALQFLTRIPIPSQRYEASCLSRSIKFFPLVGFLIGGVAALLHLFVSSHLPRLVAAFVVLLYLVLLTGGLHEDGLADAADGFGGGASPDKILIILRDSRIGSYGGLAIAFSVIGRILLIASLPLPQAYRYLITASLLCRWTAIPLSYFLSPARNSSTSEDAEGQGARIARQIALSVFIWGTVIAFTLTVALLRAAAVIPILSTVLLALGTGAYYKKRIGGITGDCFGATIQLAEVAVYLCGVWAT